MNVFDTIAAVSTPRGKGGIAVIRISGEDAMKISEKVFEVVHKDAKTLSDLPSRYFCRGRIWRNYGNERICIDDGMAVVFRAPASFTGEDTVEISCHGGALVTASVLSAIVEAGARAAVAGEFTRRAFVNGKMRLTQAEALGLLLEAETENQLLVSRSGMKGILSGATEELYSCLVNVMGSVWAKIDFPDEDLSELSREQIREALSDVLSRVHKLAATYKTGRAVAEGIPTAICGHTNVGKSSVYNRIVGYDAAIVTDIEGTTRDILREKVSLGGVTLKLSDTAGLRDTVDVVESIGIERARSEISKCELILAVLDARDPLSAEDEELYRGLIESGKQVIALYNKTDLIDGESVETSLIFDKKIFVSAKTNEGFDLLAEMINKLYIDGELNLYNDAVVMDSRQYSAILACGEALERAVLSIDSALALDLVAVDIEAAMVKLGEIDGREAQEDIVANIFSRFCVGK